MQISEEEGDAWMMDRRIRAVLSTWPIRDMVDALARAVFFYSV
jgi:hypothetical protein